MFLTTTSLVAGFFTRNKTVVLSSWSLCKLPSFCHLVWVCYLIMDKWLMPYFLLSEQVLKFEAERPQWDCDKVPNFWTFHRLSPVPVLVSPLRMQPKRKCNDKGLVSAGSFYIHPFVGLLKCSIVPELNCSAVSCMQSHKHWVNILHMIVCAQMSITDYLATFSDIKFVNVS